MVIVESPAKAKTIGRYLGKDFRITASVGHIRDLPSSMLGVDVKRDFKPIYITKKGKEKVVKELKEMASTSDTIYIATDPDREGEAIAWHISNVLKVDPLSTCRISFNEITQKAVKVAVEEPRAIDMDLVNAQQARRILDRLVGYELSPFLWKKVRRGLSAGRVQSVATRLIVDREKEINAFVKEEYWNLTAHLTPFTEQFPFKSRYQGKMEGGKLERVKLTSKEQTDEVIKIIDGGEYLVEKIKKGNKSRYPSAPFTTSTLQQEASRRVSFSSRKTMSVAQQLYEGVEIQGHGQIALVSYIRTDSVRISNEALEMARELIKERYGAPYLPSSPRLYKNKSASQDAHEAIRPAHFEFPPEKIQNSLTRDQYRLYKLIWDRFVASQMSPAKIDTLTVDIVCNKQLFRTQGETVRFSGFLAAYEDILEETAETEGALEASEKKKESERLPDLSENQKLSLLKLDPEQKFTLPPPRYTEASLIRALEEKGIGRPSTFAPTISTILERNYVEKEGKFMFPTELGSIVTTLLEENFKDIVDVEFTAQMENELDNVELGKKEWVEVLSSFYPGFHEKIEKASEAVERVKMKEEKTGEKCPQCGTGDLVIKLGRYGKFVACSSFPDCNYSKNIQNEVKGSTCPICGSNIVSMKSKKFSGRIFYVCDKKKDPECSFISWDIPVENQKCETCGSYMVWKRFRGKAYPKCASRECPTNASKTAAKAAAKFEEKKDAEKEETPKVKKAPAKKKTKVASGTTKRTAKKKKADEEE